MMRGARRSPWSLVLALVGSVLIHLGVLVGPGWGLPGLDDGPAAVLLETRLTPAIVPVAVAPRPPPPRKTSPVAAQPDPVPMPSAAPEPVPPPDAVPPAPTFEPAPTPPLAPVLVSEMASRWPRDGRMVFQVTRGDGGLLVGESTHTWQHDGERYNLRVVTETVGLAALFRPARVEQVSTGGFDTFGLRPHSFETVRGGQLKESVRFDVALGQVFLGNGQSAPLVPGTQDLLALFHQLGAHSADQGETTLNIATGRKMSAYRIVLVGVERVVVPYGEFRARHYLIAGDQSDDATEIWIDQQTGLPVKIRHRDRKGEVFDQLVTHIELKDAL
ncbi:MAG: DUF3108 domain-containing protein [Rhodocyclaceae bacterium]|nr:DUF3108 domain-containing protein [Rhodocyclaceae bacterium]MDZ4213593.1 DUF3108 domain-containing protein [Rhodocyclaceae bacterium]